MYAKKTPAKIYITKTFVEEKITHHYTLPNMIGPITRKYKYTVYTRVVLGGFLGFPETPSISIFIVHESFLNQWMVKTWCYHQR